MKGYTDIEQSRELEKILPKESADMHYSRVKDEENDWVPLLSPIPKLCAEYIENIPCWSLSALLDILPDDTNIIKDKSDTENEKYMCTVGVKGDIISTFGNNPVDVCYKMIIKLNEQKLL